MDDKLHKALLELEESLSQLDEAKKLIEKSNKDANEIAKIAKSTVSKTLKSATNLESLFKDWVENLKTDTSKLVKSFDASLADFKKTNTEFGENSNALIRKTDDFIISLEKLKISDKLISLKNEVSDLKQAITNSSAMIYNYIEEFRGIKVKKRFSDLEELLIEETVKIEDNTKTLSEIQKAIVITEISLIKQLREVESRVNKKQLINTVLLAVILVWLIVSFFIKP